MIKPQQIKELYSSLIKQGSLFKDYNFRNYVVRRAQEDLEKINNLTDQAEIKKLYDYGQEQLDIVQRQVVIQNMYFTGPNVLEVQNQGKETQN